MRRIEPHPEGLELSPPTGGSWVREPDGGLAPADAATAAAAGLEWPEETPATARKAKAEAKE